MAFDTKQLKTCRELLRVTHLPCRLGITRDRFLDRVFVRFGRFYVTNEAVLVSVEWPEYEHAGDYCWHILKRFEDDDGKLIPFEIEEMPHPAFSNDRIFEDHFTMKPNCGESTPIDPTLLKSVLKLFEINRISPIICHDDRKIELTGHNRDVCIRAVVMGKKAK